MADWVIKDVASSVPFDNETNSFVATDVQTAIEEAKQNAEGFPRAGLLGTYNGTVSNNQWLGPNELLPNTPFCVFPVKTKLNEITWANQTTNVQFRIQFRTVSKTGTIFHTLTVTSTNPGYGYVSGLSYTFNPGDIVYAQYLDDGTNCSDMSLTLWISRIP
jgi:hypothetical protein